MLRHRQALSPTLENPYGARHELSSAEGTTHSASYVQDGVGLLRLLLQQLDGLFRRHDEQFDFAAFSLSLHLLHHRQAPLPVPTTRRRHFHGIPSSSESGVCPKASRNFLEAFFSRLRTSPRSITTSWS